MSRGKADLDVRWSKREKDLLFYHSRSKVDSHLVYNALCIPRLHHREEAEWPKAFTEELEARGYDLTTLRFSIRKKVKP